MAPQPKFAIGDMIWRATWDSSDDYVACPDCGGTGRIRVIMHDESQHSIACGNCSRGYDPPTGQVRVYDRKAKAECVEVTGMEIKPTGVIYHSGTSSMWWNIEEADAFATQEEAQVRADEMAAQLNAEERQKILTKEKDARSWAWNASYHRKCVKQAQRDLEYHTAKLNVAAVKAKEPVAA